MQNNELDNIIWVKKPVSTVTKTHNASGTFKFRMLDGDNPEIQPSITHTIQQKIQQGRVLKKMTQKELAMKINVSIAIINSYESGKIVPNKIMLRKIQNALGICL